MIMLTSLEDIAVFRPVAEVLGDKFFFVASPAQVYDALPGRRAEDRESANSSSRGAPSTATAIRTGPDAAGTRSC
jgi:hypothetical protein